MITLNIFLGSFGANIPMILAIVLLIAIIVAVKSSKSEDYSPTEDWQNNKVINVTLNGGIIGLLADSPQRTLNRRIKKENADGWSVVQVIPADSGNLFLTIFRLVLLLLTLFIFTTANGYYVVMERRKFINIKKSEK
ncbi:hypothetical protein Lupro_08950 [Lutibacter profundi]|uniref:Uncharacterized protein n=1 Tax=Lutibacter profundi TaxID=1622118 RepID=A0A120IEE1_9FLAO|nr:hypothetical protein [Lutibacter profundi]AMC11379.1 hypothetical protein Lupro_08950 [Lutibacter profundi]